MLKISEFIDRILADPTNETLQQKTSAEVAELCKHFPAPGLENH
jgi:glycine/serine hydroxymethyltransferase